MKYDSGRVVKKSPAISFLVGEEIWIYTRSNSCNCWVVPSACIGRLSSVATMSRSTLSVNRPEICRLRLEFTDTSRLFPHEIPRDRLPLLFSPPIAKGSSDFCLAGLY